MDEDATFLAAADGRLAFVAADELSHVLVLLQNDVATGRVLLGSEPVTIGRVPPCDLVLDGNAISRMHCRVHLAGGNVVLTDLNSTNGTFVDGQRIIGSVELHHGNLLQVGSRKLSYERRTQREIREVAAIERDLQSASAYVQMLLPKQIQGGAVSANWLFLPCAQLGGNAFGYRYLSDTIFAGYVLDVAGQGTGAAMHSVAVMNLLRQPTVPDLDYAEPAGVLSALDTMMRPDDHNGLFFSIWYFAFDLRSRRLRYASAGSHPGFLITPDRGMTQELAAEGPAIGLEFGHAYADMTVEVPAGSMLYLLSNSAIEGIYKRCYRSDPACLKRLVRAPMQTGIPEPLRVYHAMREAAGADGVDEDFSVIAFTF